MSVIRTPEVIGNPVTSGTSGSVLYVDSSGNLAQDNSNFLYDAANTQIKIPVGTSSKPAIRFNDSASSGIYGSVGGCSITLAGTVVANFVATGCAAAGYAIANTTNQLAGGLAVGSTGILGWQGTYPTLDTGLGRNAAGVVEVNNTTLGTFRDILARGLRSNAVTFANAPASPVEGTLVAFTDSSTASWGFTITGAGSNHVLGYYNGTAWTVAAK